MTQEIRHKQRLRDNNTILLPGEIAYADSNTIKVGDGEKTFAQLPEFSTNDAIADNSTVNTNASHKLQALGTVNKNSSDSATVIFDWIGTTQQYTDQQIATAHPDWLCFITDDLSGGSASSMYTKAEIDAFLSDKADGQGAAVMVRGDQSVEGDKIFLNSNIKTKSTQIDSTVAPAEDKWMQMNTALDKNGKKLGVVEIKQFTNGNVGVQTKAAIDINGTINYSPIIGTYISQDGQTRFTQTETPTNVAANDQQIVTTKHVMNVLKAIYPVGAIYIGTQSTCPMSTFFGTWELVSSGRALWTGNGSNGNSTIAAGLPDLVGDVNGVSNKYFYSTPTASGVFTLDNYSNNNFSGGGGVANNSAILHYKASNYNSIYGNSTTVQPPAYVVNVWRRTA